MPRGYRPVKSSTQKAANVARATPTQRKKSRTKCGMARIHLTSQRQRERDSSSEPSTISGYSFVFMAPACASAGPNTIGEDPERLPKLLLEPVVGVRLVVARSD